MRRVLRTWGVSGAAWLGVIAIAGVALAGSIETMEAGLTLSPKGALTGKTIDSAEPFEMTLHLQGDANETYTLDVAYEGDDIGTCAGADASIAMETNPDGKAVWTCDLATSANDGEEDLTGMVNFVVSLDDAALDALQATISVRPAGEEEVEEVEEVEEILVEEPDVSESGINHGHCVSFWAHESKSQGLEGRWRGGFISGVAGEESAVAPKTAAGGDPGAECDFQDELDAAKAEMEADQAALAEAREAKVAEREARKASKPAKSGGKN